MEEKKCSKCKETRPLDEFYRGDRYVGGRKGVCQICIREYNREYNQRNRDKRREYNREYNQRNRDKGQEYNREYRQRNPVSVREAARRGDQERQEVSSALATKRGRWSESEVEILLMEDGLTTLEKAIKLGRTYRSCESKIQSLRKEGKQ